MHSVLTDLFGMSILLNEIIMSSTYNSFIFKINLSSTSKNPQNSGTKSRLRRRELGIIKESCLTLFCFTVCNKIVNARDILGESLSSSSARELKNLEGKLEKAISKIRTKKVLLPFTYFVIFLGNLLLIF